MLSILNETKTKVFQQEQLTVRIFPSIQEMGSVAAKKSATKFVAYWKANRK